MPDTTTPALPFDLLGRLGHKEADGVGGQPGHAGVDADLGVPRSIAGLHLDSEQQQLQLHKAKPGH